MKIGQKFGILVSAALAALGLSVAHADTTTTNAKIRIAVVNVQQVFQQSPRVASLSKKLETEFKDRQDDLNKQQQAFQDASEKFKKEAPTMSQKDRDAATKKLTADRADLLKKVLAFQQDFQKEQTKITQGLFKDLDGIVSDIAKKQSYNLVLDAQPVLFAADREDITQQVSDQFNKK